MSRVWALVFAGSGGLLLIYGIGLIREARTCRTWPQVTGQIISAESSVVGKEKNRTTYAPNISYRYVVAGKTYEGSRLTLVPRNTISLQQVQSWLAPYSPGSEVRVFYDPQNPSGSVLVTTTNGTEWAYAIAGLILLGLGGVLFFRASG